MAEPLNRGFQTMLQAAVQSVQWTYSIFWKFCHQQGNLIWGDGYYNGAIKTRKTVQPMEVSAEEASLQRSQQLRELYESLSAGETSQPTRRPSAALSPEDLTESEWFYLMCVSFSFSPGSGLPGKAYAGKQHVWLVGANEVDSKTFSRAILAKSAHVQTVVCIPLLDGVVELGTIDRVDEDVGFIQHIKSFFINHSPPQPKPALSEHSTSNPTSSSSDHSRFHSLPISTLNKTADSPEGKHNQQQSIEEDEENNEDDDEIQSDSEAQTGNAACIENPNSTSIICGEASELMMPLEMSDQDIRLGSPEDGSSHLDSDFYFQEVKGTLNNVAAHQRTESSQWASGQLESGQLNNIVGFELRAPSTVAVPPSSSTLEKQLTLDGTHYSQTVATILRKQSSRWVQSSSSVTASSSIKSSFTNWTPNKEPHLLGDSVKGPSQWLLKHILFSVPLLHTKHSDDNSLESRDGSESTTRLRKVTPQDELSANHVLAERRRREKLNEKFILLRSLVPFVTKMDKASILGDTIEYLKQLRRRIEELEALHQQMEIDQRFRPTEPQKNISNSKERSGITVSERARSRPSAPDKRKMRIVDQIGGTSTMKSRAVDVSSRALDEENGTLVQVSIIESDALLELQCQNREGVLLDVMQILRELQIEVTSVQSSVNHGILVAELRAKVKEIANGKKASIAEVRKAVNQIIPHND